MRRSYNTAHDVLEGVRLDAPQRPLRLHVAGVFPPEVEARIHAKEKAGLSRRVAEEVVNRELATEAAK